MREYETLFVTRPDAAESQTKELLEKLDKIIERHGGTILNKKNWGKRDLAYLVGKYNQGVYHYYDYTGGSGVVHELERALKLSDLHLKYLTVLRSDMVDIEARMKEISEEKEEAVAEPTQNVEESERGEVEDE